MRMEGSSDSGCQRSVSSRGLKSSGVSDRNPILIRANSIRSSGDTSNDSGFILGRKGRELGLTRGCEDGDAGGCAIDCHGVSLRQWLDNPERAVVALECLHIFRQIVEVVFLAHSQGIVVHNVRPSCFVMTSFNHVSFIESASCSDSGSDSYEDESNNRTVELEGSCSPSPGKLHQQESQLGTESSLLGINRRNASQMISGTSCLQSGSDNVMHASLGASNVEQTEERKHSFPMKQILRMETNWYTSPEEVTGAPSSCASDIYQLGVLLFELYCTFSSAEEKSATMSSLRHRVLPPQLLLKWPKEASFCLWLLHPQPTSRPKMDELLKSEFLNEPRDNLEKRELAIELREKIDEQELLEFLLLIQQREQEAIDKLHETVTFISSDIEEVTKLQTVLQRKGGSSPELQDSALGPSSIDNDNSGCSKSRKRFRPGFQNHNAEESDGCQDQYQKSEAPTVKQEKIMSRSSRLMRNFKNLESAYFLTRCRDVRPTGRPFTRHYPLTSDARGSIVVNERSSVYSLPSKEQSGEGRQNGWINSFLEGLCKF